MSCGMQLVKQILFIIFWILCHPVFWLYSLFEDLPWRLQLNWKNIKLRVTRNNEKTRVVIIGGGFTGSGVALNLQNYRHVDVTLVDKLDYFEYIPSILRAVVEPQHQDKIQVPYTDFLPKVQVVPDQIQSISTNHMDTNNFRISFDYLVLSTGSTYQLPPKLKSSPKLFLADNYSELQRSHHRLANAEHVLIIGGGYTGVELAAEIIEKFPKKQITVVHSGDTLLPTITKTKGPQKYASKFLERKNVKIIFGHRVVSETSDLTGYNTDKDMVIRADVAYYCARKVPNTNFHESFLKGGQDGHGYEVNEFLQAVGNEHVFCGGDVAYIPGGADQLAQTAEIHADVIATNILRSINTKNSHNKPKLRAYHSKDRPIIISLGRYDAIFVWKFLYITGLIPALVKEAVEWKSMAKYWKWRCICPQHDNRRKKFEV